MHSHPEARSVLARVEGLLAQRNGECAALRKRVEALEKALCPSAEICSACPCAPDDDACFPCERLLAERDRALAAIRLARAAIRFGEPLSPKIERLFEEALDCVPCPDGPEC